MYEDKECLEEDFIIFNSKIGLRDFVTIGEVDSTKNQAWLEEPYEMVGPFCLDELCSMGQISFATCVVMSKDYWKENQTRLRKEALEHQRRLEEEFYQDIYNYNKKRKNLEKETQKVHRKLLSLPLDGELDTKQIKDAFRKVAKIAHPDVGGTHEMFVKITQAKEALLN